LREAITRLALTFLKPGKELQRETHQRLTEWRGASGRRHEAFLREDEMGFQGGLCCRWPDAISFKHAESPDGSVKVLFDGHLVNGDEMGARLPPEDRPCGGAELLLQLYFQHGDAFLEEVNGWFVVLVLDLRRRRAVLATDRNGIYPLFYTETEAGWFVAADAASLPHLSGQRPQLDLGAVADWLAFNGPLNRRTLFAGVERMPPGAYWVFDGHDCLPKTHFDPLNFETKTCPDDPEKTAGRAFARVVPRYGVGPEDLSFSMTGGWDTRAITAHLPSALPSHTYGANPASLDARLSRRLARALGAPHRFIRVGDDFVRRVPELAYDVTKVSDGLGDVTHTLIFHVLDRLPDSVRRVLTGNYGSEFMKAQRSLAFQGNLMYVFDIIHPDIRSSLMEMARESHRTALERCGRGHSEGDRDLMFTLLEEIRHIWTTDLRIARTRVNVLAPYVDNDIIALMQAMPERLRHGTALQRAVVLQGRPELAWLPTDKGEVAQPRTVLDSLHAGWYRMLSRACTVCRARRLPPYLHVDALPFAKLGTYQWRRCLREELAPFVMEILLDPKTLRRGIFEPRALEKAVRDHVHRRRDCSNEVRKAMALEMALRTFFDGASNGGAA